MNQTASGPILTTEGIPLKVSLQKSERKNKIRAFLLVAPLLVFILVTFLIPIGDMLVRSVDDRYINITTFFYEPRFAFFDNTDTRFSHRAVWNVFSLFSIRYCARSVSHKLKCFSFISTFDCYKIFLFMNKNIL